MSHPYKHLVARRDWKVCRSCWSAAVYDDVECVCAACGGTLQMTPLQPRRGPLVTPDQWATLAPSANVDRWAALHS